eukprot:1885651-Pleurochrysis_carterae.AAC.1
MRGAASGVSRASVCGRAGCGASCRCAPQQPATRTVRPIQTVRVVQFPCGGWGAVACYRVRRWCARLQPAVRTVCPLLGAGGRWRLLRAQREPPSLPSPREHAPYHAHRSPRASPAGASAAGRSPNALARGRPRGQPVSQSRCPVSRPLPFASLRTREPHDRAVASAGGVPLRARVFASRTRVRVRVRAHPVPTTLPRPLRRRLSSPE